MKTVKICGLTFGEGLPKICVPLTSTNMPALMNEAAMAKALPADMFEWRMDGFFGSLSEGLKALDDILCGKPLLCTMRSGREGGSSQLSIDGYVDFLKTLVSVGGFGLVDIELSCGEEHVRRIAELARENGIGAVISRHDFSSTPDEEELYGTLIKMKALGADLPKLAVMPNKPSDVLALMNATARASEEIGPVITMAMGSMGRLSRVCGQITGSCLSFGAGAYASAPGQIYAEDLKAILEDLSF